jgi:GT2 family glycosyltransferase
MNQQDPLFSVLTPVYDPPIDVLQQMIDSVRSQTFDRWEHILVDDLSPSSSVRDVLRRAAGRDSRIRVIERTAKGGISAGSNDAIAIANGQFLALLDHDDLLSPDALEVMARVITEHPDVDYLYSDEGKIDESGRFFGEFRKPDWSPEYLRSQMYTCHLSVIRAALVEEIGGFDGAFDGSQDHDLVLRVTERAKEVVHVPSVLYYWRVIAGSTARTLSAKPWAWDAGRKAVQAHLDRIRISATAFPGRVPGTYELQRQLPLDYRVSVIISTRGTVGSVWGEQRCFVLETVRSALAATEHPEIEFVVVYDPLTPERVLTELAGMVPRGSLVLVPCAGSINSSRKRNLGSLASSGEAVVLLNDNVEVRRPRWLENLVGPLLEPDVGLTGARLVDRDGGIRCAGYAYEKGGYQSPFRGLNDHEARLISHTLVNRECSGVSTACAAVRRAVFEHVGGLCERLPSSMADVDLSMKIASAEHRVLWLANVELFSFDSFLEGLECSSVQPSEYDLVDARWGVAERTYDSYMPSY